MARRAKVVIGAAWGDEGKGLLTDAFAGPDTLVVRFNGGAQAGHTVSTPDGRRHVFHHIGSGAFRGAATYLSRFFVHNPLVYFEEIAALQTLGVTPRVLADPRGVVTTPFDMILNQMAEEARGATRHGSCGLGINETITRHERSGLPTLTVSDLSDPVTIDAALRDIRTHWVPRRLGELGVRPDVAWQTRLTNDAIIAAMVEKAAAYAEAIGIVGNAIATHQGDVLFEGAQGLLLDAEHKWFPHVTRSRTGLTNVETLAREAGIDALDVTYATRAYATRHGAGPFPRETPGVSHEDRTNVPNPWQGTLRFGDLDLDLLAATIHDDLTRCSLPIAHGLAITCLDQIGPRVRFWHEGALRIAPLAEMQALAHGLIGGERLASHGRTRTTLTGPLQLQAA
jgi:adenylosuccinate synthase